jgi:hypothetical protein
MRKHIEYLEKRAVRFYIRECVGRVTAGGARVRGAFPWVEPAREVVPKRVDRGAKLTSRLWVRAVYASLFPEESGMFDPRTGEFKESGCLFHESCNKPSRYRYRKMGDISKGERDGLEHCECFDRSGLYRGWYPWEKEFFWRYGGSERPVIREDLSGVGLPGHVRFVRSPHPLGGISSGFDRSDPANVTHRPFILCGVKYSPPPDEEEIAKAVAYLGDGECISIRLRVAPGNFVSYPAGTFPA